MQLKVVRESEVDATLDKAIRQLQLRAFPGTKEFVDSRYYIHKLQPDDLYVLAWDNEQLIGQTVVYFASCSQGQLACLGNVCSAPDARGKGCAQSAVGRAIEEARGRGCDWVVLFCSEQVSAFYGGLGFKVVDHNVWVTRTDGSTYTRHHDDICMIYPLSDIPWPSGKMQLEIEEF